MPVSVCCMSACLPACLPLCLSCLSVRPSACVHVRMCVFMYMHTNVCVCIYICVCGIVCSCVYMWHYLLAHLCMYLHSFNCFTVWLCFHSFLRARYQQPAEAVANATKHGTLQRRFLHCNLREGIGRSAQVAQGWGRLCRVLSAVLVLV